MANTTNFNWETPDDTDLVKDGAAAMRTLGNSIDTSFVDLKGGTTGQVLSKASNTDLDYTWVTTDDANAIQNAIVDAKGDLIAASANDTPARLAVGNNGETLVADSSTSTGLRWQGNFAAGKNKIINGDFGIWQRGTSFTLSNNVRTYCADRFTVTSVFSAGSSSVSRQTFTPGTAPVAGYEGQFFQRITAGTTSTYIDNFQFIEDVRTFAGQTITFSFWAKASSAISINGYRIQNFGSGGSSEVAGVQGTFSVTTDWQRFTTTFTVPSISGKTVGTSSFLAMGFYISAGIPSGVTIDTWGWQVEASNTATAFQTATGTIQGELAACQRYYYQVTNGVTFQHIALAIYETNTKVVATFDFKQTMRVTPTLVASTGIDYYYIGQNGNADYMSSLTLDGATPSAGSVSNSTNVSGSATTAGTFGQSVAAGSIAFSAEL